MSDPTTWVANTIRDARERRGWSQSELARRLNRTQTAVSYWEAGKRVPGLDDISELADVLEVAVESFFPGRARKPVAALLRATAERLADTELHAAIDELVADAERAASPAVLIEITATAPGNAANELVEKAEISQPPIDVEQLAVMCGVLVFYHAFPDSLSGLVFAHDGTAVIGVNTHHHANRQRFSVAHELGHYLLGHHQESRGYEGRFHIDTSEGMAPGFDWRAERAANDFAAEILMPRRFISAALKRTNDPTELAQLFIVSELAMGYRLVNLGIR